MVALTPNLAHRREPRPLLKTSDRSVLGVKRPAAPDLDPVVSSVDGLAGFGQAPDALQLLEKGLCLALICVALKGLLVPFQRNYVVGPRLYDLLHDIGITTRSVDRHNRPFQLHPSSSKSRRSSGSAPVSLVVSGTAFWPNTSSCLQDQTSII